jgi:hypothetical protein
MSAQQLTTDDVVRRELLIEPIHWFKKDADDGLVGLTDQGVKVYTYVRRESSWARPLVGRLDIAFRVRTWKAMDNGWAADLLPVLMQPSEIHEVLGLVDDAWDQIDPQTKAEAMALPTPCETPLAAPAKPAGKAKTTKRRTGRAVNSGSCVPPTERVEPLKFSALTQNIAESQLLWNGWLQFQEATDNSVGHSTFIGMCALAGVESVLSRFTK